MKLRIEKAIYGGAGLARVPATESDPRLTGKTVFVPFTLPGELVQTRIIENKRSFATGALDAILEPSPERIPPGCEYVPRCGGCQYQHINAAYQLQIKVGILKETLSRAHVTVPGEIQALAGPSWGYRNRIRLHIVHGEKVRLGYRQGGSHNLLPVSHCPIAAPMLEQAIAAIESTAKETAIDSLCDQVELFTNSEQDQLLITLWPSSANRSQAPRQQELALKTFAERLKQELPALRGVGLLAQGTLLHSGSRSLSYVVAGDTYQVSLGGFFQVNRFLLPDLRHHALHDGKGKKRSGRLAWDLYAGAGLFACALDFENVTAVESEGFSADDLKHNLAGRRHEVVRSTTLDFLRNQLRQSARPKPDLILVDPPRAGLEKEVCTHLGTIAAPEIIYVSCDPATLARDLQSLQSFGYTPQTIALLDQFPQTFHMETITHLRQN